MNIIILYIHIDHV